MQNTDIITEYHGHIYFDEATKAQAEQLCLKARDMFGVSMGRMHDRPVGPHPMGSCQLGATPEQFAKLLPWLALNHAGLIVFCHPSTGDHLADHRDHAIWIGAGLELNLAVFG
ncbi:MAG: DOPA 4,5-dioxygenase family protein [Pseudomonadota bacterium]